MLAREKLHYGCSYWNVRDMLLCGVRTDALEFLDGRFRLKAGSLWQSVDVKAWKKSIVKILRLKRMTRSLESALTGRSPEFRFQQATQAAQKLAENFCPLPNKTSVLLINRAHSLPKDYVAENLVELAKVPRNFMMTKPEMRLAESAYLAANEMFACVGYWAGDMRTTRTDFDDEEDFAWWLKNIRSRSRIKTNVTVTPEDSIVTFSTCAYPTEGDFDQYAAYGVLRKSDDEAAVI
ncbi:MAG: hypothetical protein IJ685_06460 [Selenomonadaceae bacterium]|nr:hypothetical protein [Selenomonadaceae bacterium]